MTKDDDDYWAEQVTTARRTQLATVRSASKAWAAVFAGILGLFSTVTFVGGLNGLNDLAADSQTWVRWGILIAAAAMLVATVLSALASNSMPSVADSVTGGAFRDRSKKLAVRSLLFLRISMGFAMIAALMVIVGSGYIVLAPKAVSSTKPPTVVAVIDGTAYCGPLTETGGKLTVDGQAITSVTVLTEVAACP